MRRFLITFIICFMILICVSPVMSLGDGSRLRIPQIKYKGGNYNPRPAAIESLLIQIAKRTSVEVKREYIEMDLKDPRLFEFPFLYMAGDSAFEPFSAEDLKLLRTYLSYGGFLLIDDNSATIHSPFDDSVRKMIAELFPNVPLQKISRDHSIFRSFYLINRVAGRVVVNPFLEGIAVEGRTVVLYSTNDMGGAWARNKLGHWKHDMIGGSQLQRKMSIRLGVNIVVYALTLDYKKDMVHLPIILERLRRYHNQ